jgi:hypothetical protein
MDKLVPQLPEVVTIAYELCFMCVITHLKGIFENYTLHHQTVNQSIV